MELRAADTLADISTVPPPRCHGLSGKRADQFAVDVQHPFWLIFEPAYDPAPQKEDGGIDLARVTAIRILEVTDYHG